MREMYVVYAYFKLKEKQPQLLRINQLFHQRCENSHVAAMNGFAWKIRSKGLFIKYISVTNKVYTINTNTNCSQEVE
jgi:hypothetical protein